MSNPDIEIMTEQVNEKIVAVEESGETQYMILNQNDGKITLLNQDTGETLTYLTNDFSNITVMPAEDENVQEVTVGPPDVDHIEDVAMATSNESEDAVQQAMMVADLVDQLP